MTGLAWSSDGFVLAAGSEKTGFSVWSAFGRMISDLSSLKDEEDIKYGRLGIKESLMEFRDDYFVHGVKQLVSLIIDRYRRFNWFNKFFSFGVQATLTYLYYHAFSQVPQLNLLVYRY